MFSHPGKSLAGIALAASILLAPIAAVADDHIPDPEAWYRTSYAPLWNGTPEDDVDAILQHYASEIVTHESDGAISSTEQVAWLAEPMGEWVAEGWLRAEMTALQTQVINTSTAAFIATWKDYYQDGSTEVSCGWYLADFVDGQWLITSYADTSCP